MITDHVRLAEEADIPVLLKLAENFMKSSPYRIMKFDRSKGKDFLRSVINGPKIDSICLVALDKGVVVGFIVGAATEPVFSSNKIAMELGWWIEPEHRGTRGSLLLYTAYEDWAYRVGCSHVQGAYLPGTSVDLDSFYKKRGYVQTESSYVKVLRV